MPTNYEAIAQENLLEFGKAIKRIGQQLLADRYSDRTHFLYELLQNAEDAIGWRLQIDQKIPRAVSFRLSSDSLFFEHSGLQFAEEHVRGICNIGLGTKSKDLTTIGMHGIGFKSVYAYTHHPEVHSGEEHFVIESFVRPREINPKATVQGETLFVLPFDHPEIPPATAYDQILGRLHSLGLTTLLFLRNISTIKWEAADGSHGEYLRETRQFAEGIEHITLMGQSNKDTDMLEQKWLVLRKEVFNHDQKAGYVEVAFKLETNSNDSSRAERIIRVSDSPLVVFFPTEKETHLGFLIQGPYRTTPSRDNVPKNDKWNQYLVSCTAKLVTESLEKIRNVGLLTSAALGAFVVEAEIFEDQTQAAMFRPIAEAIIDAITSQPLIPRYKSGHISASCARLARTPKVRTLINAEQLTSICNSSESVRWVSGDITRDRMGQLYDFLTRILEVEEIDAAALIRRMSERFLKSQSDEWIQDLYEFLHDQQALQKEPWFASKPWVRLSTDKHVTAKNEDGELRAYLPSKRRSGFSVVKKSVCSTENAINFLQQIGLKEADPVDDVIVNVLVRYKEQSADYPAEFDEDIERVCDAYLTDSLQRRKDLLEKLKEAWWIPCRNDVNSDEILGIAEQNTYIPTQKLKSLFAGNEDVWFVDRRRPVMGRNNVLAILKECGVSEFLQRSLYECDLSQKDLRAIRQNAGLIRATSENSTDYTIQGLETTLKQIESALGEWQDRARLLWDCLHDSIRNYRENFLFGEYKWSFNRDSKTVQIPAKFVRMLRRSAWLPGKDGTPRKPSQVCFSDLPPDFQESANETFVSLLEFKPDEIRQLAEITGIDTAILDLIREHGLTLEQLRNRLGIKQDDGEEDSDVSEKSREEDGTDEDNDAHSNHNEEESDVDDSGDGGEDEREDKIEVDDEGNKITAPTGSRGHREQGQHDGPGVRLTRDSGEATGPKSGRSGSAGPQADDKRGLGSPEKSVERDLAGILPRIARESSVAWRRELEEATSTGVAPIESDTFSELKSTRTFQSDSKYREAVLVYERSRGRIPELKSDTEEGHDIDSYVREKGNLGRKLARRIEVKGKGVPWSSDEIVEMSDRQFTDATNRRVDNGIHLAENFDYWLYVVEDDGTGALTVLPIRNPALRAAHFEFRAGTWRHLAEKENGQTII